MAGLDLFDGMVVYVSLLAGTYRKVAVFNTRSKIENMLEQNGATTQTTVTPQVRPVLFFLSLQQHLFEVLFSLFFVNLVLFVTGLFAFSLSNRVPSNLFVWRP